MNIFDASSIIKTGGYTALFAILFSETGILIGFFLPGDSLLFTAGYLASAGYLNITTVIIVSFIAAVLGDALGYSLGRKYGYKVFNSRFRFFPKEIVPKAQVFYKKHGGKTIIFARFMPVIRTIAPILAGVGNMGYRLFAFYNLIGAIFWTVGISLLGYFLGKTIPNPDRYVLPVIAVIVIISIIPSVVSVIRMRNKKG